MNMDIDSYTFEDLLELFNIRTLNESNLKVAYKKTMKTHPDYSKLDKSYFLFFVKAFKLLKKVHEIQTKNELQYSYSTSQREIVYRSLLEKEDGNITEFDATSQKNGDNFNKWFNNVFDNLDLSDKDIDAGYEKWLRSESEEHDSKVSNIRDMHEFINNKKREYACETKQDIIAITDFANIFDISREKCEHYDSSLFSSLQYQDLKKAHTETLIPVSEAIHYDKPSYSFNEYKEQRDTDMHDETYFIGQSHKIDELQNIREKDNIQRQFSLAKQIEQSKRNQSIWTSSLRALEN